MRVSASTYVSGDSPVHACDARAKIAVLIAYTAAIFFVDTWAGMALMIAGLGAVVAASRIGLRPFAAPLPATIVLMALAVVFGTMGASGPSWEGFASGCFVALRILALVVASLVVSLTSTSTALMAAFASFLRPLRAIRVPVDDIAMALSIALRFVPLIFREAGRVRSAQWSRGAAFETGCLASRVRAWGGVFVPVFVGLFRHADALAIAMDARCYGARGAKRSALDARRLSAGSAGIMVVGVAACAAVGALL